MRISNVGTSTHFSLRRVEVSGGLHPYHRAKVEVLRVIRCERWAIWDSDRNRFLPGMYASKNRAEEKLRKLEKQ